MKTSSVMMAGAVIGNLVIVPAIAMFGDAAPGLIPPGIQRIAEMDIDDHSIQLFALHRRGLRHGGGHYQHVPHAADDFALGHGGHSRAGRIAQRRRPAEAH